MKRHFKDSKPGNDTIQVTFQMNCQNKNIDLLAVGGVWRTEKENKERKGGLSGSYEITNGLAGYDEGFNQSSISKDS